jgi:outer membrane protein OmpA-like peptidoglycan-associated protein
MLASFMAPPKPPAVDESLRRPANRPSAVELQSCRHELHNARLATTESARIAAHREASQDRVAALKAIAATEAQRLRAQSANANRLYRVQFAFASTQAILPVDVAGALIADAKGAPLVVLKGRTDGTVDNAADARIARERATAVRDLLVAAGVDPIRIRTTHQAVGDGVRDNTTPLGRAANRRVDIEVYSAPPVDVAADAVS